MKKIISLFKRDYEGDRQLYNEVTEGAEWVLEGAGIATRKYDGTCCLIQDGKLYKRYDAKNGKTPPENFIPAQEPDPITGHYPGWLPVGDGPNDKYHREAFDENLEPGTYELCGPKINGNPENIKSHKLIRHGVDILLDVPRDFEGLKNYLSTTSIEGVVFYNLDGRMVKIKTKDFGIKR